MTQVKDSFEDLRIMAGRLVSPLSDEGMELNGYRIGDPVDEIAVWISMPIDEVSAHAVAQRVLPDNVRMVIVDPLPEAIPA